MENPEAFPCTIIEPEVLIHVAQPIIHHLIDLEMVPKILSDYLIRNILSSKPMKADVIDSKAQKLNNLATDLEIACNGKDILALIAEYKSFANSGPQFSTLGGVLHANNPRITAPKNSIFEAVFKNSDPSVLEFAKDFIGQYLAVKIVYNSPQVNSFSIDKGILQILKQGMNVLNENVELVATEIIGADEAAYLARDILPLPKQHQEEKKFQPEEKKFQPDENPVGQQHVIIVQMIKNLRDTGMVPDDILHVLIESFPASEPVRDIEILGAAGISTAELLENIA